MAGNVWWTKGFGSRRISATEWSRYGTPRDLAEWNESNGWSIPESAFTPEQLAALRTMDGFLLGQTGLRPYPPPGGGNGTAQEYYDSIYYLKTKELYEAWMAGGGGSPGGGGGITESAVQTLIQVAKDELNTDLYAVNDSIRADTIAALEGKGTYSKPGTGIPESDLASAVAAKLALAVSAIQAAAMNAAIGTAVSNAKSEIIGGAGAAYDSLVEIQALMVADDGVMSGVLTSLGGKQPLDDDLTAIAALASAANKMLYATGAGTWALADLTAAGRALIDDADAAAQRVTLGNVKIRSVTTAFAAAATLAAAANTDYWYFLSAAAGVPTLPTAVGNTNEYVIVNKWTAPITVLTTSSQTISGAANWTMQQNDSITLISDNANWWVK